MACLRRPRARMWAGKRVGEGVGGTARAALGNGLYMLTKLRTEVGRGGVRVYGINADCGVWRARDRATGGG